jgi:CelD/BcsL family acetyltransferase involved in cellulose biosynthesis
MLAGCETIPFDAPVAADQLLVPGRLVLRYFLGDVPLLRARFNVVRLNRHFTQLGPWRKGSAVPWEQVPPQAQCVLYLSHPVDGRLPRLRLTREGIVYVPLHYTHYYIDLSGTFDDYLAKFNAKSRYNMKREVRLFCELSGRDEPVREFSHAGEIDQFLADAAEISAKTYQQRLANNGLPHDDAFRRRLEKLSPTGGWRGYILYDKSKPVAYFYGACREGILTAEWLGFDPQYRRFSPGGVLLYFIVRRLYAQGRYRMLDFGHSEAEYKRHHSTGSLAAADIHYFRLTARNLLLVLAHAAADSASHAIGWVMTRLRIKAAIKRFIRRRSEK